MKTEDFIVHYGLTGGTIHCPGNKCTFSEELPYPLTTLGNIKKIADKHMKEHRSGR